MEDDFKLKVTFIEILTLMEDCNHNKWKAKIYALGITRLMVKMWGPREKERWKRLYIDDLLQIKQDKFEPSKNL